jgi:holo-[acyl-carrier protein] synthase
MLARVFTPGELAYCRARPRPIEHLAARFAAKEAAFKAVGTGWARGVRWRDAEVVSPAGQRPALRVRGALLRGARALGPGGFAVSLSHSGGYAVAMVIYGPGAG